MTSIRREQLQGSNKRGLGFRKRGRDFVSQRAAAKRSAQGSSPRENRSLQHNRRRFDIYYVCKGDEFLIILNQRIAWLYVAAGFCMILVLYCCGVLLLYFVYCWYCIAAGYCDCIDASAARERRRAPAHGRVGEEVEVEAFHVPLNEGLSLSCSGCVRRMVASQRISLRAAAASAIQGALVSQRRRHGVNPRQKRDIW